MATKAKTTKARRPAYSWRPGHRPPVPAAVAGAALERVRRANGGAITPRAVVDAARDPAHPLHPCFEWDDSAAAEEWRRQQARVLIHSVRVEYAGGGPAGVGYLNVTVADGGRAYLPAAAVLTDAAYRAEAVADALRYLDGFKARYRHLHEMAAVFAAIDAATQPLRKAE